MGSKRAESRLSLGADELEADEDCSDLLLITCGSIEEVDDETSDSPELEALWLRLRARSRGHHNIRALLDDAKDTTHFAHCNEHDLVARVYGHHE